MFKSIAIAIAFTLAAAPISAFTLEPISRTFSPAGSSSQQSYAVINDGEAPIAIEVSFVERLIDSEGNETNQPADDLFLAVPPQMIVPPGGRQTVRVSWLGDADLASEQAYRIVVEQLPIPLAPSEVDLPVGQVQVLTNYRGSLYIRPAGASPAISLTDVNPVGDDHVRLTFLNSGSAHGRLRNPQLELTRGSGDSLILSGEVLSDLDQMIILPGHTRVFTIPVENSAGIIGGSYTGQF